MVLCPYHTPFRNINHPYRIKLIRYGGCCQADSNRKDSKSMRYSAQIRAARALLGWSQGKLARVAGIGLTTLQRIEQNEGVVKGNFSTVLKKQKALEPDGIHFTAGYS